MNTPMHRSKQRLNVYIVVQKRKHTHEITDILRVFSNLPKAENFCMGEKTAEGAYLDCEKWSVE